MQIFLLSPGRIAMIPTGYRAEFESKAEKMLNWLDSRIESLELTIMKATNEEQGDLINQEQTQHYDSPSVVIEKIDKELPEAKEDMELVNALGERYRKDLSQAGENVEELDQLFEDIEERWSMLDQLYKKATILIGDQATVEKIVPSEEKPVQQPVPEKPSKGKLSLIFSINNMSVQVFLHNLFHLMMNHLLCFGLSNAGFCL